jgi:HEPN domain-containing protein
MSENNSYKSIANEDLRAAKLMLDAGMWNHSVRHCQQYVEKILKACIELNGDPAEDYATLHIHVIQTLAKRCTELALINFTNEESRWLRSMTSYYFDVNYPGARYISIDDDEATEVYQKTMDFKTKYESQLTIRKDSGNEADEINAAPYK